MHQTPTRRPALGLALALVSGLALTGCEGFSNSNYNPLSWFKTSAEDAPAVLYAPIEDPRPLVAQVLTLKVEPTPDGAILRATGLPPTQGWWGAALVKVEQDDASRLVYEFRLIPPLAPTPAGTPRSREVTVALALSVQQLQGVGTITVQGEGNALSSRR
jgi:hypothetical protein